MKKIRGFRLKMLPAVCMVLGGMTAFVSDAAAAPNDYDGDGVSDPAVYAPDGGMWYAALGGGARLLAVNWGWEESRPVPGDYDGDGVWDFAVYHRPSAWWYVYLSSLRAVWAFQWGWSTARPLSADFDGDGKSDPAVYDRQSGGWYILLNYGRQMKIVSCGFPDAYPVPADYDGDGISDPAVNERRSGEWYFVSSKSGALCRRNFGWRAGRPVPADYDGDGICDFAVYRRQSGGWYIIGSAAGYGKFRVEYLGGMEYEPAAGDYDGDGKADLAVYHRKTGTWLVRYSSTGSSVSFAFGSADMTPLAAYENGATAALVVLAFGDSITYGQGSSSGGPATGYPRLLEYVLESFFGGHAVSINAGVPGETTGGGLRRLPGVLQRYRADVLLLMEGTNDHFYGYPFGDIESRLRQMIAIARQYGVEPVIATIPPVNPNASLIRSEQQARIHAFNPRIYTIASDYGIPVAPVYESITAQPDWQNRLIDRGTGNHPNDAGYQLVKEAFRQALQSGIEDGDYY